MLKYIYFVYPSLPVVQVLTMSNLIGYLFYNTRIDIILISLLPGFLSVNDPSIINRIQQARIVLKF